MKNVDPARSARDAASLEDLSFRHLLAEMERIDVLIQRQVRLWQKAGQDPKDNFRGLYVSDETAVGLLSRPLGANWGTPGLLDPEETRWFESSLAAAQRVSLGLEQQAHEAGVNLRLKALAETFALDDFDRDVFLICLSSSLDLRYERLFGYLQDDVTRKRPSVNLVLDLLCPPGPVRLNALTRLQAGAPLIDHHLLERLTEPASARTPLLNQTLAIDDSVVSWLIGDYRPSSEVSAIAEIRQVQDTQPAFDSEIQRPTAALLESGAFDEGGSIDRAVLVCYGPDLIGQETAAASIANRLGKPLLAVDLDAAARAERSDTALSAIKLAMRDARLLSAIPLIAAWDSLNGDSAARSGLIASILAFPGLVILTGRAFWQMAGFERSRRFSWLEFPAPGFGERRALWSHFLKAAGVEDNLDLSSLAGQFTLTSGQIRDAVASAMDRAAQRGEAPGPGDLQAAARLHSSSRLAGLARKIPPRYTWKDIILPADQMEILKEIINTIRTRSLVLGEWGLQEKLVSSAGVTVLFAGPPGTGKTMAAEIIAGELGLDLYKIDLSTIVSKYIGETEKNLEHIFQEAEASNAILFFDEADALFGKRSEVRDSHDRYANIEISYLLQRMEAYDGVTILATNLRANLDEAFTRRLQFVVDFPFPEEEDRLRLWQTLFPWDVPHDPALDFNWLARRYELAGGNIRNIIVSAAYLAAADGGLVTMEHLLYGTRRELQKMGRLIAEENLLMGQRPYAEIRK